MKYALNIFVVLLTLSHLSWGYAQEAIDIAAHELTVAVDQKKAIFSGDVTVVQGQLTLSCDLLTVYQDAQGQPDKVVAEGNVYLRKKEETATGKKATWYPNKALVLMEGDVTLQRGNSTLRGDALRYDLASGTLKMNTKRAGTRVKAKIEPKDLN
jgi:lipopolysaccharide export system protein LptA